MQLEDRILAAGRRIESIAERLRSLGYVFDSPDEVFAGPTPDTEGAIERIEREVGSLPLAIKIFWRQVGSVNFMGEHPDWEGCPYPDPIVIYPPVYAIDELDQFLDDREERMRCDAPYCVPISPDAKHKENVSGGPWYSLSVPAVADDPPLNDEPHETTFANYLELVIRWSGFPGLDRWREHNYPLVEIRGDAKS
jgi:hypothetical protein